jgi:hypothetical protein
VNTAIRVINVDPSVIFDYWRPKLKNRELPQPLLDVLDSEIEAYNRIIEVNPTVLINKY